MKKKCSPGIDLDAMMDKVICGPHGYRTPGEKVEKRPKRSKDGNSLYGRLPSSVAPETNQFFKRLQY